MAKQMQDMTTCEHVDVFWLYLCWQHLFLYDCLATSCLASCELHCCLLSGTTNQIPATQRHHLPGRHCGSVHHSLFPHSVKMMWRFKDFMYNLRNFLSLINTDSITHKKMVTHIGKNWVNNAQNISPAVFQKSALTEKLLYITSKIAMKWPNISTEIGSAVHKK